MMRWFGEPWGARICDTAPQVSTPVGAPCFLCPEPIEQDDREFVVPTFSRSAAYAVTYRGCFIQSLLGYENGAAPSGSIVRSTSDGRRQPDVRGSRVAAHDARGGNMATGGVGYVFDPGEGRKIDLGNFSMTVKGDDGSTAGLFTLLEADEPPNFGPPMHIHHGIAEAFYVLEGEYIIFMNEEEFRCPAGSFIFIPAEAPHGFRVGETQSKKLNLYLPASMVGYFDDLSRAIASGEADPQVLDGIATRYGVEVIGPVPKGYL
jgi:mannose-6-phosphate isomerase-like protein (cupin superfamily)